MRKNYSSGAPWEEIVGYSRAVKINDVVEVSGTTSVRDGKVVGSNAYEQTKVCLKSIQEALENAGASLNHVVRTRMFVTDITNWEEVGRAHGEFFSQIKPATTMVEISNLIDPKMLVEIEVTAISDK